MRFLAFFVAALALSSAAQAEEWPQWRGPFFNGSTTRSNLPAKFSQTENVAWSVDLPGPSAATPVVWKGRVFISTADTNSETLKAMCFDRRSGDLLWECDIATGIRKDTRSNFASPSPATDGNVVVFFYGNGDLAAFDLDGKEKWRRNLQKDYGAFYFLWTFSTSPVLYDGKLYMQVLQRDVPVDRASRGGPMHKSYLLAIEPETGKTLWRHFRPSKAKAESLEAFTTPIPYEYQGRKEILVAGGDAITGHDPETGAELWRWGTWNPGRIPHWRLVPSPVAGDGVILACAPKKDPIYALKAGGEGVLSDGALAWVSRDNRDISSDVPTPAFYDGDFFVLSDVSRSLSRVEPKTGKVKWTIRTPGRAKYEASPLAADGKIYIVNFDGDVSVIDADQGKVLHTAAMEDERSEDVVRSSIAAAHGQLFIRTTGKLYCIGR